MKQFGFGCMRLPMIGGNEGEVDQAQFERMVDKFLAEGFTYFDTAHGYISGKSETAIREGLVRRYPRDRYQLTDKLSGSFFKSEEDIRPLFQQQLEACGVDYFDYYLMHALSAKGYAKFTACRAFEIVQELKAEGKVRHVGISFHDKPAVLEQILTEHPEIEVVQIQFNYIDYEDPSVESRGVYEVCRKFNKPVIIMEPVKGGKLAGLGPEARAVLDELNGGTPSSYAIRYTASFEGVFMVLSGMSTYEQLEENVGFMADFQPLNEAEYQTIDRVCALVRQEDQIPCTACRYCVDGCPKHILIPELLSCLNTKRRYADWNSGFYYETHTKDHGRAGDCIGCGQCEQACPQHLTVPAYLKEAAAVFEQENLS